MPVLLDLLPPTNAVLDVGGGVGAWAAAFMEAGVNEVVCVDGDYVDRAALLVPPERFVAHDVTRPLDMRRRYDLVVCLEVAEHLPEPAANTLLASLTRHSDVVAFSAAIPGQGGEHHVNEQWPTYWRDRFAVYGYDLFDIVRPPIWGDERAGFWFRQNLTLYATGTAALHLSSLPPSEPPLDLVHPETWRRRLELHHEPLTIRQSLSHLRAAIRNRRR